MKTKKAKTPTKTKAAAAAADLRTGDAPSREEPARAPSAAGGLPPDSGAAWAGDIFSVGHQPAVELGAAQKQLFQSFQSNLVSLLSHELRTPLMSILNALSAIDEQGRPIGGMGLVEALDMARSNARRLEAALSTVLDLAAWEAGVLQVAVAETSLGDCLQQSRLAHLLPARQATHAGLTPGERLLGDPAKLARAFSRFEDFISTCGTNLSLRLDGRRLALEFELDTRALPEDSWRGLWHEVLVARESGGSLPLHVFAGVLQSERAFLSRSREGLGAELHLIAEILRQHEARFAATLEATGSAGAGPPRLRFEIEFPPIEGRARIVQLLRSRIWRPGATQPEPVVLSAHGRDAAPDPESFAIDPKAGPWIRIGDPRSEESFAAPAQARLRCPEDGHDPEVLVARLLALAAGT